MSLLTLLIERKQPMTNTLLVQSQDELDKALADGVADLRIEHPLGIYLTISDDPGFWPILRGNSHAVLRGNARAMLWGNARAILWGNSHAMLWGNASAELRGNSHATLWGNASAALRENASATLRSPLAKATGTGHVIDMAAVDLE